MTGWVGLLWVASILPRSHGAVASHGADAMGPEQAILDAYLAQFDRYPNTQYCERVSGLAEPSDGPRLPQDQLNGTNSLMDEHDAWHTRHGHMQAAPDARSENNTYGNDFVVMHRMAIMAYDAWRAANGHAPVADWDPATPIPSEFRYAIPDSCASRASDDPRVPLPTWLTIEGGGAKSPIFNATRLCDFGSMNQLGKELDDAGQGALPTQPAASYHQAVHKGVGGDMDNAVISMRDPVFWAWHKFLDQRIQLWETQCAHMTPFVPTSMSMAYGMVMPTARTPAAAPAPQPPRATPAWTTASVLVAAVAASIARMRGRRE